MSGTARDILIRGGRVLTMDARGSVLDDAEVLVEGGRISRVGRGIDDREVAEGVEVLDASGCIVLPGLVQGHLHLGQTLFRGLAERRRLLPWLRERIWPLEAAHDDDSAYWGALLGACECLLGGTTTIQDIGIPLGARGLLEAIRDSGLRGLAGPCLMDAGEGVPDALRRNPEAVLGEAEALGDAFGGAGGGRLEFVLNPRFILSCSDALWRGIRELADRRGWPIHTHALEQREECAEVERLKGGRDEIDYFDDEGVLDADLRIAHGVWLSSEHLDRVSRRRFSVVHCPSSNLKLGSGFADVVGIRRAGVPVGVGADGAACNNRLDAFAELRLAALLQHARRGPEALSGRDALRLATDEGARAIGLGERCGRVAEGYEADLVVLALEAPGLLASPAVDPHDLVAFSGEPAAVRDVLVGGRLLVRGGALTELDLGEIRRRAAGSLERLLARADLAP